jgi:uncharacterized membrane protein
MGRNAVKKIVLTGLMIALTFLTTYVTRIPGPVPPGYINFGDVVILLAALLIGRDQGMIAGAVGSAIADIAVGGFIFAPITLVVKGLEGYVAGLIAEQAGFEKKSEVKNIAALIAGSLIMVAGYFLAELYILRIFDSSFGFAAAYSELPLNLIQGGVSSVVAYVLFKALDGIGVRKLLA